MFDQYEPCFGDPVSLPLLWVTFFFRKGATFPRALSLFMFYFPAYCAHDCDVRHVGRRCDVCETERAAAPRARARAHTGHSISGVAFIYNLINRYMLIN